MGEPDAPHQHHLTQSGPQVPAAVLVGGRARGAVLGTLTYDGSSAGRRRPGPGAAGERHPTGGHHRTPRTALLRRLPDQDRGLGGDADRRGQTDVEERHRWVGGGGGGVEGGGVVLSAACGSMPTRVSKKKLF